MIKKLFCLLLLLVYAIPAIGVHDDDASVGIGTAVGVLAGVGLGWLGKWLHDRHSGHTEKMNRISQIEASLATYKAECDAERTITKMTDRNKIIVMTAKHLMRRECTSEQRIAEIEKELVILQQHATFINRIDDIQKRELLLNEIENRAEDLKKFREILSDIAPFVELNIAEQYAAEQLQFDESSTPFPKIKKLENMERFDRQLLHWIQQAQESCRINNCTPVQQALIERAQQKRAEIQHYKQYIVQQSEFAQEQERFERIQLEEKRADMQREAFAMERAQIEQLMKEQDIKRNEQEIEKVKQAQNEEALRQHARDLEEHRLLRMQQDVYDDQLAALKADKKKLMRRIEEFQGNEKQLRGTIDVMERSIDEIQREAAALEEHLTTKLPVNPESKPWFAEFLTKVKERAVHIKQQCSPKHK
jgi:hypothetical protein